MAEISGLTFLMYVLSVYYCGQKSRLTKGWSCIPIKVRASTSVIILCMADVDVAWVWLNYHITSENVTQSWCIFATDTGSLAVWSHGHRQFLDGHCL